MLRAVCRRLPSCMLVRYASNCSGIHHKTTTALVSAIRMPHQVVMERKAAQQSRSLAKQQLADATRAKMIVKLRDLLLAQLIRGTLQAFADQGHSGAEATALYETFLEPVYECLKDDGTLVLAGMSVEVVSDYMLLLDWSKPHPLTPQEEHLLRHAHTNLLFTLPQLALYKSDRFIEEDDHDSDANSYDEEDA
jgi:hypothetical protein